MTPRRAFCAGAFLIESWGFGAGIPGFAYTLEYPIPDGRIVLFR